MKRRYMISILIVVFGILFWAITRDYANKIPVPISNNVSVVPEVLPAQKLDLIVVSSPLPVELAATGCLKLQLQ
jgi:hypothetical protein